MYDAVAGRFLARDPIGFAGGVNLFTYVAGSPLVAVDPEGMLYVASPAIPGAPPQVTIGGGVLIGSIWIGKKISEPFWKWVYRPRPWEPKVGPLPKPIDCPEGFDPHPDAPKYPRDCWDDYLNRTDSNEAGRAACIAGCLSYEGDERAECEEGCEREFDTKEENSYDELFECSSQYPDWDPSVHD